MCKRLLATLTLVIVCLAVPLPKSHAIDAMVAKNRLIQSVTNSDIATAEQILFEHAIDKWTLGHALMTALNANSARSERTVHRLANLLVAKGAHIDYSDYKGKTLLMEAIAKRFETVTDLLLVNGADMYARDDEGRNAWDYVDMGTGEAEMITWILNNERRMRKEIRDLCKIQNLSAKMRDDCVVITYDLEAPTPVPVALIAEQSKDRRRRSLNVVTVKGDVGNMVPPGKKREIIWEIAKDYPSGVPNKQILLDVIVTLK